MARMRVDVAVVGAGPAGAWTACQLAERGARVALLDSSHPREKACGGGITGRALAQVAHRITAEQIRGVTITSARFFHPATVVEKRGRASQPPFSTVVPLFGGCREASPALVVASRRDFDSTLLTAAAH